MKCTDTRGPMKYFKAIFILIVVLVFTYPAEAATQYNYTATTKAKRAKRQGAVKSGSLTWDCQGNKCRISGPWPNPAVSSCRSLAKQVGPIARYGHKGKWLSSKELNACNEGISETIQSQDAVSKSKLTRSGVTVPSHAVVKKPSNGDSSSTTGAGPNSSDSPDSTPFPWGYAGTLPSKSSSRVLPDQKPTAKVPTNLPDHVSGAMKAKSPFSSSQVRPQADNGGLHNPELASKIRQVKMYEYTATTKTSVGHKPKTIHDGTVGWSCRGKQCTVLAPWPNPGVKMCKALAKKVGKILSYGHPGKHLNAEQITECNKVKNRLLHRAVTKKDYAPKANQVPVKTIPRSSAAPSSGSAVGVIPKPIGPGSTVPPRIAHKPGPASSNDSGPPTTSLELNHGKYKPKYTDYSNEKKTKKGSQVALSFPVTPESNTPLSPGLVKQPKAETPKNLPEHASGSIQAKSPYSTSRVRPPANQGRVQNPAISSKLREARKAESNEDQRFLQARERLRRGNVIINGARAIFVFLR